VAIVRVVPMASVATAWFGSGEEITAEAGNLFQLVEQLERRSPGFAEAAGVAISFAVNGELAADWTVPLVNGAEILLVPRIGGG